MEQTETIKFTPAEQISEPVVRAMSPGTVREALRRLIEKPIAALGLDCIYIDIQASVPKVVTVYIDFLEGPSSSDPDAPRHIGLNDCIAANAAIDEIMETTDVLDGAFTLEVSSPGVDRPLVRLSDFERFSGKRARIQTHRLLTAEEMGDLVYFSTHPTQKKFAGLLCGVTTKNNGSSSVRFESMGTMIEIPFESIEEATLEYGAPAESGGKKNNKGSKNKKRS